MSLPEWPECLNIRELASYLGIPYGSLRTVKAKGELPPLAIDTARHQRWRRADIEAWLEMKMRGLVGDWLQLRGQLGEIDGWAVMLKRLEAAQAKTAAVVREVA